MASSNSGAVPLQGADGWSIRALYTVAFLGITAGLQMADGGVQTVSLSSIQASFAIGDAAIGALQGLAGVLVGSALAVPLARLADHFSRRRLLLWLIAASSIMLALGALAPNFPLFFLGRSAAGIVEFAMVPLVYSMIPDLAPARHRVPANLSFAALMAVGASCGFYFSADILAAASAWIPLTLEPWRKAFLLLALLGVPLLLAGLFTCDPPRARARPDAAAASLRDFVRARRRAVALFVGSAGCLVLAVQALNQLSALAMERRFDASAASIGHAMGIIVLITSLGALPLAGLLDRLIDRRVGIAARPLIMAVAAALAVPVLLLMLQLRTFSHALPMVGAFLLLTCIANALVPTMLQDLAPATLRARCFAVWSFVVSIFAACGPLLAGMLSDWVFSGHVLHAIVTVAVPALVVSALCAGAAYRLARTAPAGS